MATEKIESNIKNWTSTPTEIGKLNGVTVLRVVKTGNTPSASGSIVFTDIILRNVLRISGNVLNTGSSRISLPGYYVSANDYMFWYPQGDNMMMVMGRADVLGNRPYVCIIDYLAS